MPMKGSKDISGIFQFIKVVSSGLWDFVSKASRGDFFSNPSHDMAKHEQLLLVD